MTFTSMFDAMNRGLALKMFCSGTNITPQATENGKIIAIDLSIKEYGAAVALYGQQLWKFAFQRSIEQRDTRKSPRPVFLWADECQFFVTSYDAQFLSTCRSSRVSTVFLTQNISNIQAALGGQHHGEAEANSIFGNLNTKVFHANGDPVTNGWASTLIGRTKQFIVNANSNFQPMGWLQSLTGLGYPPQVSAGVTECYEFDVQPTAFTTLRTGGRKNKWNVDAIVFQNGQQFKDTGKPWRYATFRQKF
jgi:hypothetical protein